MNPSTATSIQSETKNTSPWTFRLAEPADAPFIAKIVAENPQIDSADISNGKNKIQPTVMWFVAEKNGIVVAAAPVFLSAVLAHLALNPESRASEKLQALNVLKDGVSAFMIQFGIRHIQTMSKPEYGVAKWAVANGFDLEPRQLFVLDLNGDLEIAAKENELAAVSSTDEKGLVN